MASNYRSLVISAQSAQDSTHTAVDALVFCNFGILVEASAGVSAGVVTLETAASVNYAGTWGSITTVTTNAASTTFISTALVGRAFSFVRARISTAITGGTVNVYLIMHSE